MAALTFAGQLTALTAATIIAAPGFLVTEAFAADPKAGMASGQALTHRAEIAICLLPAFWR
jgi:hypothetical protein